MPGATKLGTAAFAGAIIENMVDGEWEDEGGIKAAK